MTDNLLFKIAEAEIVARKFAVRKSFEYFDKTLTVRANILEQRATSLQGSGDEEVSSDDQKIIDGCYHRAQEIHLILEQFEKLSIEDILRKGD